VGVALEAHASVNAPEARHFLAPRGLLWVVIDIIFPPASSIGKDSHPSLKYMSTSLTVAAQTSRSLARGDAQWFLLHV